MAEHTEKNRVVPATNHGRQYYLFECPGCGCAHAFDERWTFNDDLVRPTFRPSLLVHDGGLLPNVPRCHSFVTDGRIQFLADCDHALAGQTVDLPPWEASDDE